MASKPNIDDVKLLQEALATKLEAITTSMVEAVLTGVITSHDHNYTTSTDVSNLINTAIASVYKPKGNIADKTALLALTNIKQGDVYNAQSSFTLNGQNVKAGDNIVCLADAATSSETNWDNLGGNIDFAAALSQALIGFSATSGNITSSDTILSAINKLAYDKHIHGNLNVLDLTTAAFTTEFKNQLSQTYSALHSHSNKTTLDAITAAFTTALKTSYDGAVSNSHTHSNKAILDAVSAAFTTALKTSYDGAVTSSHTHSNKAILDAITAAFTTELEASYATAVTKAHTHSNLTALDGVTGTNTGDETTTRIGSLINGATAKTTPVDADMVGLMDSAASNVMKKLSWARIKTTLKAYFDTMYTKLSFSKIRVGGVDIVPSTNDDRIEFIAGTNVTLTPDAGGKKLTIAAAGGGGGGSSYRGIEVNNTLVLDSSNGSTINICDGVGTIVGGGWAAGERVIYISTHMGSLEDSTNGIDLQRPGMATGIWSLIPGQSYLNTPNPICGTDVDSINLAGTYTYSANDSGGTWTYHDHNTNKMYISSWYNDPINGDIPTPWKRLLTCTDEIATEPEEVDRYSYLIDNTNTYIYIDTTKMDFDFKDDKITIDLANYSSPGYILKISIYFTSDTGSSVNVDIIDSANPGKQIRYGNYPHYVDPGSVGSLYCINYEIACLIPYWLVGNRIYS